MTIFTILPFLPTLFIFFYQWRERKVTKVSRAINKDIDALAEHTLRTASTDAEFKQVHVYWDAKMRAMWRTGSMALHFWKPVESYYPPAVIKDVIAFKESQKSA
jgi:hypothetical protein